jgi:hypothetical protein
VWEIWVQGSLHCWDDGAMAVGVNSALAISYVDGLSMCEERLLEAEHVSLVVESCPWNRTSGDGGSGAPVMDARSLPLTVEEGSLILPRPLPFHPGIQVLLRCGSA